MNGPRAPLARDLPGLDAAPRARLPADQHRPHRGNAGRDRRQLARLRRARRSSSSPDSVTIYQMELPFNTTISRDLLKGTGAVRGAASPTGRPSGAGSTEAVRRRCEARRLPRRQRVHRRQGSVAHALRVPRPPLAGRRPRRPRRGVVRPRERRAHAEPGPRGSPTRAAVRPWRDPARTGPTRPTARGAHDPRAGAAAEAGLDPAGLLPRQVRRSDVLEPLRSRRSRSLHAEGYLRRGRAPSGWR